MAALVLRSSLLESAGFAHGFATRQGGVSAAPFDTLNFRVAGTERPENVGTNLRRLSTEVGFDPAKLNLVDQVHGARVLITDTSSRGRDQADAIVLANRAAGGIRVADCVPILVGDLFTGRAAAIHAGWRGIEACVIGAALAALGDSRNPRVAAIGPCIGPCCFEVGMDVAKRIEAAAGDPEVIARKEGDKAFVDLRLAARAQLRAYGMSSFDIEDVEGCTRCDKERFFSFRRDGENSGRHLAVIVAKEERAALATFEVPGVESGRGSERDAGSERRREREGEPPSRRGRQG
jgi:polyphenol oxidase